MNNLSVALIVRTVSGVLMALFIAVGVIVFNVFKTNIDIDEKRAELHEILLAANEYKSQEIVINDILRAYVVTGEDSLLMAYNYLLGVRLGKKPRLDGVTISTRKVVASKGCNDEEDLILNKVEISNKLASDIGQEAIQATRGMFNDGYGNYIIPKPPDRELAISLLYGNEYIKHKKNTIKSLNLFSETVASRYSNNVAELNDVFNFLIYSLGVILFLGIILTFSIFFIFKTKILLPITSLYLFSQKIAQGDFTGSLAINYNNEIGKLAKSFRSLSEGIMKKSEFVKAIGTGELEAKFEPLSEKDEMGKLLLETRQNLIKARQEEQKRKEEDDAQNWINEGLAQFADILRKDNDSIKKLADNININIVKYLGADLGGLFIINDQDTDDKYIEMMSCFAFERHRSEQKRIELSEGLVGRCVNESETIYMTDIPNEYLSITSGLGGEQPQCLLLVPLKINEIIFGVIELASFKNFEPFQISFVEQIGESIASTLMSAKINVRTNQLLQLAQENAEKMLAQEEEMRQNFEELTATQEALDVKDKQQQKIIAKLNRDNQDKLGRMLAVQEEMETKEAEMKGILNAINSNSLVAEYDLEGNIRFVNEKFATIFGKTKLTMQGKQHIDFENIELRRSPEYRHFWNDLKNGLSKKRIRKNETNNVIFWLSEIYTPIYDKNGDIHKVLMIADNITQIKKQELEMEQFLNESRMKEMEVEEKNEQIEANEEELRQNLEEMQTIRDSLSEKDRKNQERIGELTKENLELSKQNKELHSKIADK